MQDHRASQGESETSGEPLAFWRSQLYHPRPAQRAWAAREILHAGAEADHAIPDLQLALNDPDPDVRWDAACSLVELGHCEGALPVLAEAACSDLDSKRRAAVGLLEWMVSTGDTAAIQILADLAVKDPAAAVRGRAISALRAAVHSEEARRALVNGLDDHDDGVRRRAAAALQGREWDEMV